MFVSRSGRHSSTRMAPGTSGGGRETSFRPASTDVLTCTSAGHGDARGCRSLTRRERTMGSAAGCHGRGHSRHPHLHRHPTGNRHRHSLLRTALNSVRHKLWPVADGACLARARTRTGQDRRTAQDETGQRVRRQRAGTESAAAARRDVSWRALGEPGGQEGQGPRGCRHVSQ